MVPETPLGWPAGSLIGQPSEFLLGDDGSGTRFNPFRPSVEVRRHRAWLRCRQGGLTMMSISAVPLHDASGAVVGARGVAIDMTGTDTQTPYMPGG